MQKILSNLVYLSLFILCSVNTALAQEPGDFLFSFGTSEKEFEKKMSKPTVMAVSEDQVFIVDEGKNRVNVFDNKGELLRTWSLPKIKEKLFTAKTSKISAHYSAIAVSDGKVFIAEKDHGYLLVYDLAGNFLNRVKNPTADYWDRNCEFFAIDGIASSQNKVYVLSEFDVFIFTTNGNFIGKWNCGLDEGTSPKSITVHDQTILIAYKGNPCSVHKFLPSGKHLGKLCDLPEGICFPDQMVVNREKLYIFQHVNPSVHICDQFGSSEYKFELGGFFAYGFAVQNDTVLLSDLSQRRIVELNSETNLSKTWGKSTENGELLHPKRIAISQNEVYVTDGGNHRIQVFDLKGNFLRKWGTYGEGNGEFDSPMGVAVYKERVFVADQENERVQVFDTKGNFLYQWGYSQGNDDFFDPEGITICQDKVFVADAYNRRVLVFDLEGKFMHQLGNCGDEGAGFVFSSGIESNKNEIFVADSRDNYCIEVYSLTGEHLRTFPLYKYYFDITVNNGMVFVTFKHGVEVFDMDGKALYCWKREGIDKGGFDCPMGITVHDNKIYVADTYNDRIQVFQGPTTKKI
jgi:DNA-binding beta-propeller fold protein YncE